MRPILFYIGDLPIFTYSIFMILGMITLFGTAVILAHRAGRSWESIWPVAVGVFVGGILGARLTQIMVEPARTAEFADFYSFLRPGTLGNIVGMMIGGFVGGLAIRLALELPSSGNFYAPALAAASVLWRIGCTMAGCCHGVETNLPWEVTLACWPVGDGKETEPEVLKAHLDELFQLHPGLRVLTMDAGFTQRNLADLIVQRGRDYVMALKDNQPNLHETAQTAFASIDPNKPDGSTTEKVKGGSRSGGSGSIPRRRSTLSRCGTSQD